jgi:hypothetical protein
MPRSPFALPTLALLAILAALLSPGSALVAMPSPTPAADLEDAVPARNAGTIVGRVDSIDYKTGVMTVDVGQGSARKTYDVMVVPGTNIQGNKDFHTIADLKKGARVQVLMSQHGATYTAQIIHLL